MEELRLIRVGNVLQTQVGRFLVRRTSANFKCENCALFFGTGCIAPKWRKNAICFANERPDKESVYFVHTKRDI